MSHDLKAYYAQRAGEYEKIYALPERQADLLALRKHLRVLFAAHDVLELACGTGYWTQYIAETAHSILATDINEEVISVAREKSYPPSKVSFLLADAFAPDGIAGDFTAAFVGFLWSHIPKAKIPVLLGNLHNKLGPGRLVAFVDNNYVQGEMHPITTLDAEGNSYQLRKLESGKEFSVLKNFPTQAELREQLQGIATNVEYTSLKYYWLLSYITC